MNKVITTYTKHSHLLRCVVFVSSFVWEENETHLSDLVTIPQAMYQTSITAVIGECIKRLRLLFWGQMFKFLKSLQMKQLPACIKQHVYNLITIMELHQTWPWLKCGYAWEQMDGAYYRTCSATWKSLKHLTANISWSWFEITSAKRKKIFSCVQAILSCHANSIFLKYWATITITAYRFKVVFVLWFIIYNNSKM